MPFTEQSREAELEQEVELLRHKIAGLLGTELFPPAKGMSPSAFRILHLLAKRSPHPVPFESLFYAMTENFEYLECPQNNLKVHVSRGRRLLSDHGVRIRSVYGFGYVMDPESKTIWQRLLNEANGLEVAA